jgi:CheY-like chemotaxis protein
MSEVPRVQVRFKDRYRLWQEFILASERDGRVFVSTDEKPEHDAELLLEVSVGGEQDMLEIRATVEARRPPNQRFGRGVFVRLEDGEVDRLRDTLGLIPADSSSSRRSRRDQLTWPVSFRTPALLKPVNTEDISAEGMHIDMPERVRQGHVLEFKITFPQGHQLGLAGEVMWTSETSSRVGLRFIFDEDSTALLFRRMLEYAALGGPGATPQETLHTVLVMDDDPRVLNLLRPVLLHRKCALVTAPTGEAALSLIREKRPALVLLDVADQDAARRVCESVRLDADLADVPVVFLGEMAEEELAAFAQSAGAADWLPKPAHTHAVLTVVDRQLKR